jgi:signal transduction histidine kinase
MPQNEPLGVPPQQPPVPSLPNFPAMDSRESAEGTRVLPGHLKLDDLLADVVERVQDLQGQRQRLRVLLDDVVGIASGLSLEETLRRIVEAARELVDARYAALGVLTERGGLREFHTSGADPEVAEEIGHLPEGPGIRGLLIDQPAPLRLEDLNRHPAASGFPPGHPAMGSFLGVPIVVRGQVFGNLYLTEKIGRPQFDDDDEQLLVALAGAAGIAIDNARLFEQAGLRQRWLRAGGEVTHQILWGADDPSAEDRAAASIVDAAHGVEKDDLVAVWMPVGTGGPGSLLCRAAAGPGSERLRGTVLPPDSSLAQQVLRDGAIRLVDEATATSTAWRPPPEPPPLRSELILPLVAEGGSLGVLVLARAPQRATYLQDEVDMAQAFATSAALALALAASQQDRQRLAVFADRDRIARDLHDQVIQQLFASGLTLQSVGMALGSEAGESAAKIDQVVQSLDDTIGDLRRAIFALRVPDGGGHSLRSRLVEIVEKGSAGAGVHPTLRVEGPLDSAVGRELADHVVAVVREGLSNAIRHARASTVEIAVSLRDEVLTVSVTDDGCGLPAVLEHQSGLRNLHDRAAANVGTFCTGSGPGNRGTTLRWQVPAS